MVFDLQSWLAYLRGWWPHLLSELRGMPTERTVAALIAIGLVGWLAWRIK